MGGRGSFSLPMSISLTLAPVLRARLAAGLAALTLAGCSDETRTPGDWAPLDIPKGKGCPQLAGQYLNDDPLVFLALVTQHLPREAQRRRWFDVTLSGSVEAGLQLQLGAPGSEGASTIRLQPAADACHDGWLQLSWPYMLIERDDPLFRDLQGEGYKELYVARDSAGNLVARQVTANYLEFPVWCGDGCKYIRIPFTRSEQVRWHRLSAMGALPSDRSGPAIGTSELRRRVATALPPGTVLDGIDAQGAGFVARIRSGEEAGVDAFMDELSTAPWVHSVRREPGPGTRGKDGRYAERVWFSLR